MSTVESPQFAATEALQQARKLRGRFEEALLKNPEFLKAAGKIVLHPRPNSDIMGAQEYTVRWGGSDGARFAVHSSYSRWGETLRLSVFVELVGEEIAISVLGRNKGQGKFSYNKTHVNYTVLDECENDPRTVAKAEEMLSKLSQV